METSPHETVIRRRVLLIWSRACLIAGVVLFVASSWFLPQNNMDPRTHPLGVALAGGAIALVAIAGALLLRRDGLIEGLSAPGTKPEAPVLWVVPSAAGSAPRFPGSQQDAERAAEQIYDNVSTPGDRDA